MVLSTYICIHTLNMQCIIKNNIMRTDKIDKRTFHDIWFSWTTMERSEFLAIAAKYGFASSTIHNYAKGHRRPRLTSHLALVKALLAYGYNCGQGRFLFE